jgi:hypothetical protein
MARPATRLPSALALLAGTALLASSGCGGGTTTTVIETEHVEGKPAVDAFIVDFDGRRSAQPSEIAFSANGDLVATGLRWRSWGSATATATGTFVFNPAPHTHETTVPGTLVASGLEPCRKASYYTATRLEFDERPPFQPQVPPLTTPCG